MRAVDIGGIAGSSPPNTSVHGVNKKTCARLLPDSQFEISEGFVMKMCSLDQRVYARTFTRLKPDSLISISRHEMPRKEAVLVANVGSFELK